MNYGAKMLTSEPVRVCCPFDPAIDRATSNVQLYTVTRDEELIKELPGSRIQWYHVRRISRSVAAEIEAVATSRMVAQLQAFQIGVIAVDNMHLDSGDVLARWTPECFGSDAKRDPRQGLTREELDHFPADERFDIGEVVLSRAGFRRGRVPFFPPPVSSVRALGTEIYLSADESLANVTGKHADTEGHSTETTSTPESSAPRSGAHGAATAEQA